MIPKKPAPDLIRGGHRFSEKIMREKKGYTSIPSGTRIAYCTVSGTIDQPVPLLNASTVIFTTFTS